MPFPTPLPSLILKSPDREVMHGDEVTHEAGVAHEVEVEAEQEYERAPLDICPLFHIPPSNNPWKLCYVETDEIEAEDSDWGRIASTPGVYVLGRRLDRIYEVVIDGSYLPWLLYHNIHFLDKAQFEARFSYDPTTPTQVDVEIYGWGGFYARFLENAFAAIWSSRSQGLELCLRSITPPVLQTALNWAILNRDIMTSKPAVKKKFTLCLVLLALSLLEDYNTPSAIQLLKKDQDAVLQVFQKDPADLLKDAAECQDRKADLQTFQLTQRLYTLIASPDDLPQHKFDPDYTAVDNLNLCGSHVGIVGSNHFGNFDLQAMLSAVSRSKVIIDKDINTVDIAELSSQLMFCLPIGFPSDLEIPTEVSLKSPLPYKGACVYELENGYSERKLGDGEVVKLRVGGTMTGLTSQKLIEDGTICLPSHLQEERLITLFVDYDGWYDDGEGTSRRLSDTVLGVVHMLKVGQKVLIIEQNRNREPEQEERERETLIWVVQMLQVLRVCEGHLNFGQDVPFHQTIPGEKPKRVKRAVRQRIRTKLTGPGVACSACGLGRVFSSLCCKFLGKSSDGGYVAL